MKKMMLFGFAALSVLFSPAAQAAPGTLYDTLYPTYVEACAMTQIQRLGSKAGGSGGHGAMYLKGACIDSTAAYPRLRLCAPGEKDLTDPESGVGISVNKNFKNVNWIATAGKSFFYDGGLPEGARLTQAEVERVAKEAMARDAFRGVKIHDEYLIQKPAELSYEEYLATKTIGTDFAIRFGRNLQCVRLPVTEGMLSAAIDSLNALNDRFFRDENYRWDVISDNCTHTVINALHAMGVWGDKKINRAIPRQLFNLAIPSNLYLQLAKLTQDDGVRDLLSTFDDDGAKWNLLEHGFLPQAVGTISYELPMVRENDLYETELSILYFEVPFGPLKFKSRKAERMRRTARYSQLGASLEHSVKKYERALADLMPIEWYGHLNRDLPASSNFQDFYEVYRATLKSKLAQAREDLAVVQRAQMLK